MFFIKSPVHLCRLNPGVECEEIDPSRCAKCGWNPEVKKRRVAEFRLREQQKEESQCRSVSRPALTM